MENVLQGNVMVGFVFRKVTLAIPSHFVEKGLEGNVPAAEEPARVSSR